MASSSYSLFRVRGIPIKLHISFLLFFPIIVLSLASSLLYEKPELSIFAFVYSFLLYLSLFASVLFHELVHSLVAKRFGMTVRQITLTPIGGIAGVGMIRDARKEFIVSVAGPLSNYLLAAALLPVFMLASPLAELFNVSAVLFSVTAGGLVGSAIIINLMLGSFNLFLPIFPMDGGRILRSMLAMLPEYLDYLSATRLAVRIGQAYLSVLVGISIINFDIWLVFIGAMLFVMGAAELRITEASFLLEDVSLEDIAHRNLVVLDKDATMSDFMAVSVPWQTIYPVVDKGRPVGYIDSNKVGRAPPGGKVKNSAIREVNLVEVGAPPERVMQALAPGFAFVTRKKALVGVLTMEMVEKAMDARRRRK